ncbi:HNH endonuclease signature motif containing protein [Sphingobium bisphenolivorans]|uniref:HNH endonuclease signature motif containing protein n=1 Tax=Sphingobium bisphenolivorans TaxID=1335760 RepID=UPI0003B550CB|nr:HNH endonuclease signature motif containing protein [Sphingobium bisphenolivorans]
MSAFHKAGAEIAPSLPEGVKTTPPQEVLHELVDYDPLAGTFRWKWRSRDYFPSDRAWKFWNRTVAGAPAFQQKARRGFCGELLNKVWFAHRIAWKHFYGFDPEFIDHIDGNPRNNRIANLRSVDVATNNRNMSLPRRNKSGFIGVRKIGKSGRWLAFITFEGQRINLGTFTEKADAIAARVEAEKRFGFHPNHGRDQDTLAPRQMPTEKGCPPDNQGAAGCPAGNGSHVISSQVAAERRAAIRALHSILGTCIVRFDDGRSAVLSAEALQVVSLSHEVLQ